MWSQHYSSRTHSARSPFLWDLGDLLRCVCGGSESQEIRYRRRHRQDTSFIDRYAAGQSPVTVGGADQVEQGPSIPSHAISVPAVTGSRAPSARFILIEMPKHPSPRPRPSRDGEPAAGCSIQHHHPEAASSHAPCVAAVPFLHGPCALREVRFEAFVREEE